MRNDLPSSSPSLVPQLADCTNFNHDALSSSQHLSCDAVLPSSPKSHPPRHSTLSHSLPSVPIASTSSSSSSSSSPPSATSWTSPSIITTACSSPFFPRANNPLASSSSSLVLSSPCRPTRIDASTVLLRGDDGMEVDDHPQKEDASSREEERDSKRRRLMEPEVAQVSTGRKVKSLFSWPGQQMSVHALMEKKRLGMRVGVAQLSMRPKLLDIVSHNEDQVYRCPSSHQYRNFAPPFAVAYSRSAKAGGKQVLAVADEEGHVGFLDASRDSRFDIETGRKSFRCHTNAIFDLNWGHDDQILATASGDQTVKLWDVEVGKCVGVLSGHTCTIKNVAWDPFNPNILATASRDGAIRIWDRREKGEIIPGQNVPTVVSTNKISNAHGTKGKGSKGRSATKSVTSVTFLKQESHLLASSGSSDGLIKIWDLRRSHTRRVNPDHLEANDEAIASLGETSARPHGVASIVLSPNGQRLYAYSTDNKIYAYDPLNLSLSTPLRIFSHPQLVCGTFYVRTAVSPNSRFLACGSTEAGIYVWDTEGKGDDGVKLVGHEKETSGLDWGRDSIASCSDDYLVRVWNFNQRAAREERNDPQLKWKWSGVEQYE